MTKPRPKLTSLEKRYAELLKNGQTEAISPSAHERYRRTLARLAWAALSTPDLQFVYWAPPVRSPTKQPRAV